MGGNGLGVLGTTPLQVACAFAALGTGSLPSARLVHRVGERPLPRREPQQIPLGEGDRRRIVAALRDVANDASGTAYRTLSKPQIGFELAAKTGSADITGDSDDPEGRVRKHTWVAGFVPVEDPVAVFVVFVHDTITTSSHGAAYLAESFLQSAEVRAFLEAEGVAVGALEQR